ncbi:SRPBCC domain-containing protein [Modestobacter sp. VKM Ac-2986]|uniref:SRPBCC domain-containing protein n=1 Tax=Modestobacter sp. VKM Ac-2986 TaxID=3004140 RepID=UPI0022ABA324|nr:SRPBCC domain-containing protein [Modestobacter sp. VKM Ac-2986]MCZ2830255.1 SRPBCC domain-containing protein [Modestobacter sp. VKM Ac-2986]
MRIAGVLGRVGAEGVDHGLTLAAPVDDVWAALVEPDRAAAWLGRLEPGPQRAGDRFAVRHDGTTTSEHTVVTWAPGRRLELTWEFPGEQPSRLAVALAPTAAGTRLALRHTGLEDPVAYAAGWHRHLEHLGAHLAGAQGPPAWAGYDELVERYRVVQTKGEL